MILILFGIAIGAFVFAALLWSLYRAVSSTGARRLINGAVTALIIATMGAATLELPFAIRVLGALLVVAACAAAWREAGWSRLLPLFAAVFGLAALGGLPFAAL